MGVLQSLASNYGRVYKIVYSVYVLIRPTWILLLYELNDWYVGLQTSVEEAKSQEEKPEKINPFSLELSW